MHLYDISLPEQETPNPENPEIQVQIKLPIVLVHTAFVPQPSTLIVHSLISRE